MVYMSEKDAAILEAYNKGLIDGQEISKELHAENERLKKDYELLEECSPPDWPRIDFVKHIFDLWQNGIEDENERLEEALERIQNWVNAYPLTVFPKPDLKKAHQVLKEAGMTLDAISADAMRHVLDGIKDIVEQALKGD